MILGDIPSLLKIFLVSIPRAVFFSYATTGYFSISFKSTDSNISESISSTYEKDYVFDTKFFTQELETFVALAFLSNGNKIIKPQKLELIPYFKKGCDDNS